MSPKARRIASPVWWPWSLLTRPKWSRSKMIAAACPRSPFGRRVRPASIRAIVVSRYRRLKSPVSASRTDSSVTSACRNVFVIASATRPAMIGIASSSSGANGRSIEDRQDDRVCGQDRPHFVDDRLVEPIRIERSVDGDGEGGQAVEQLSAAGESLALASERQGRGKAVGDEAHRLDVAVVHDRPCLDDDDPDK